MPEKSSPVTLKSLANVSLTAAALTPLSMSSWLANAYLEVSYSAADEKFLTEHFLVQDGFRDCAADGSLAALIAPPRSSVDGVNYAVVDRVDQRVEHLVKPILPVDSTLGSTRGCRYRWTSSNG